jgi:hypothetical protein
MRCQKIIKAFLLSCLLIGSTGFGQDLRAKIFGESINKPSCQIVDRGPKVNLGKLDAKLGEFGNQVLSSLVGKDEDKIGRFFHERLRAGKDFGKRIFSVLKVTYDEPWQFSIYRVFALNTVDGDKQQFNCDEGLHVTSLYGYNLQMGFWVQVMGENELGRIFFIAVPKGDTWKIGGFHVQQWTYQGKDFQQWFLAGTAALDAKQTLQAYMGFDIAQKMLFGGDFLDYEAKPELLKARDIAMPKDELKLKMQALFPKRDMVYVGTVMPKDGPGWLIRERLDKEIPLEQLTSRCLSIGKTLISNKWLVEGNGGVNCNFLLPREDPEAQGKLGGFYFSLADIAKGKL